MRGPGDRPVQTRGNTVSEATATTEPVVVEAMRMSNSLCEAMGEPPLDMPGIRIRKKEKKAIDCQRPPISVKAAEMQPYQIDTNLVNASLKIKGSSLYSQKVPVSRLVGAGGAGDADVSKFS